MAQTAKAQATRRRIADAAASLFSAKGFHGATVADVADESGVAPGTVILHFGSKSQLATAAFADQIGAIVDAARPTAPGRCLADDLAAFVAPIYEWYRRSSSFAPDLLREALFSDGPWADHYAATVGKTIEAFGAIVSEHVQADTSVELIAEGLLADYLLVLFQGFRGTFESIDDQVAHFSELAAVRF